MRSGNYLKCKLSGKTMRRGRWNYPLFQVKICWSHYVSLVIHNTWMTGRGTPFQKSPLTNGFSPPRRPSWPLLRGCTGMLAEVCLDVGKGVSEHQQRCSWTLAQCARTSAKVCLNTGTMRRDFIKGWPNIELLSTVEQCLGSGWLALTLQRRSWGCVTTNADYAVERKS